MTSGASDIKSKLIAVIERAEADQAALVALLSDAEKAAIGESDPWAVKDQIAHLNFWRNLSLEELVALRDGVEAPPRPIDEDLENERNFAKHQHTPWSEVIGESNQLFGEAKQIIGQLTDAQLTEPHQSASGGEFTRSDRFVADYMEHPSEHLTQVYRERGDTARAEAEERATVQVIGELSGQHWPVYGYALYNLGCSYARNGETARAIAAVGEALPLVPALVEWSQKDPDLDSPRDIPAFQALYNK
ncbi:MAG: DinB family protein [Ktedonobacterales bacterium]